MAKLHHLGAALALLAVGAWAQGISSGLGSGPAPPSFSFTSSPSSSPPSSSNSTTPSSASSDLSHFVSYFGFGFVEPVGTTHNRLDTGWDFLGGVGPRLGHYFSLPVELTYQDMGAHALENPTGLIGIEGHMHMWGFSLNPTVEYHAHKVGFYGTLGYGINNRSEEITQAAVGTGVICDPWWGFCSTALVPGSVVVGSHDVWNGAFNVGGGLTFGPPHMKFFADVRYYYMYTSPIRTETLPVTLGIRW